MTSILKHFSLDSLSNLYSAIFSIESTCRHEPVKFTLEYNANIREIKEILYDILPSVLTNIIIECAYESFNCELSYEFGTRDISTTLDGVEYFLHIDEYFKNTLHTRIPRQYPIRHPYSSQYYSTYDYLFEKKMYPEIKRFSRSEMRKRYKKMEINRGLSPATHVSARYKPTKTRCVLKKLPKKKYIVDFNTSKYTQDTMYVLNASGMRTTVNQTGKDGYGNINLLKFFDTSDTLPFLNTCIEHGVLPTKLEIESYKDHTTNKTWIDRKTIEVVQEYTHYIYDDYDYDSCGLEISRVITNKDKFVYNMTKLVSFINLMNYAFKHKNLLREIWLVHTLKC